MYDTFKILLSLVLKRGGQSGQFDLRGGRASCAVFHVPVRVCVRPVSRAGATACSTQRRAQRAVFQHQS